jgi:hypothetical protein
MAGVVSIGRIKALVHGYWAADCLDTRPDCHMNLAERCRTGGKNPTIESQRLADARCTCVMRGDDV